MNTINATTAKQNFSSCLTHVSGGPILIEKSGTPTAVMLSYEEYMRLVEFENTILISKTLDAIQKGFLTEEESKNWFTNMNEKYNGIAT